MKEELAVLDFFSRSENLPLGLSVAEQMDQIRKEMNNRFWAELQQRLDKLLASRNLPWRITLTEDKNSAECIVGLHCIPHNVQAPCMRPMMEQQYLGSTWRIYYGLMWGIAPSNEQLNLPAVARLKAKLQTAGFRSNADFAAWQWTTFYPRRKDFLLRYTQDPARLLDEAETTINTLLIDFSDEILLANESLRTTTSSSLTLALGQLREELTD